MTHGVPESLLSEAVPVTDVKRYPGNARVHDLDTIAASLQANGQFRPIIANKRTGHIIKGNGTYTAATDKLGWDQIAVAWIDVPPEDEARLVLVDNRSSELGWFNDAALVELLGGLSDLGGTGYSDDDLTSLEASLAGGLDLLPPAPAKPGKDMKDAKRKYDIAEVRTLVLITDDAGHDQLVADLSLLRADGETLADTLKRLVAAAASADAS